VFKKKGFLLGHLKMGPIGIPETSMLNQPTLRNNPEDGRLQVNRSVNLRYRLALSSFAVLTDEGRRCGCERDEGMRKWDEVAREMIPF
jgi:hypothetical protein